MAGEPAQVHHLLSDAAYYLRRAISTEFVTTAPAAAGLDAAGRWVVNEYVKGNYRTQKRVLCGAERPLEFGLSQTRMPLVALCTFCGRAPAVNFALTALNGEPRDPA